MAAMTSAHVLLLRPLASLPSTCDVIDSLYALQFLIHSTFLPVYSFTPLTSLAFRDIRPVQTSASKPLGMDGRDVSGGYSPTYTWV